MFVNFKSINIGINMALCFFLTCCDAMRCFPLLEHALLRSYGGGLWNVCGPAITLDPSGSPLMCL